MKELIQMQRDQDSRDRNPMFRVKREKWLTISMSKKRGTVLKLIKQTHSIGNMRSSHGQILHAPTILLHTFRSYINSPLDIDERHFEGRLVE